MSLSRAAFAELIPPPYLHIRERISPNDGDEVTIQAISKSYTQVLSFQKQYMLKRLKHHLQSYRSGHNLSGEVLDLVQYSKLFSTIKNTFALRL